MERPARQHPLDGLSRTATFWGRAGSIYLSYKATQARCSLLRLTGRHTEEELKADVSVCECVWRVGCVSAFGVASAHGGAV